MARSLAEIGTGPEASYAIEFEDPALLTLGCAYERSGRFAGSSYHPILKRVESFQERPLAETIPLREGRAARLLEVDAAVDAAVKALKARGFENPYLKAFVVARINPVRHPKAKGEFDEVVDKMLERARKFDASSVNKGDVTGGGGPPEE
jgi:ParB family chromosome partitioning protein